LSFEDKILIKNLWKSKRFSARRPIKEFHKKTGKDEHCRLVHWFDRMHFKMLFYGV